MSRACQGLTCPAIVEARAEREGRTSVLQRCYASPAALSAELFAVAVRAHWMIENNQPWVLDFTFVEDRTRNCCDHGPQNLATLRRLAPNGLRSARPDISIRRKRRRFESSNELARSSIG